ncbi:cysteine desulfurase [Mycoplasma phocimorsus]|uniref:cysteine desulfurase n=1 Tax=Mycoplasma phocimorsus TaxID=3045839 RepID=UPI0024BFC47F|nr:aminotransferase class V-fold PLP-dependent enzyme [Mycoplasma phocimorsus]MDJ1648974.1 aminotransferase class V-fold PLP-dependent enzyme [Mycoplasma phocimorsus]
MNIKKYFPSANKYVYFDSAAMGLKPKMAIKANNYFYNNISVSTRSSDTKLGNLVNNTIFETKKKIMNLVDASIPQEIIFTSGTTESINMFANMFKELLKEDDEIIIDELNHSSNMFPWISIAKQVKAKIIISSNVIENITNKTKLISIAQETNSFNKVYDIDLLSLICKQKKIILFNDAAQSVLHYKASLNLFDAIAFSTNKFYGPTGLGILAVNKELLAKFKPFKLGGGVIKSVENDAKSFSVNDGLDVFEAGTPNIAGIFMFNKSLDFFNLIGYEKSNNIIKELSIYLHKKLQEVKNIKISSKPGDIIVLFNIDNVFCQDVSSYLAKHNIYTRAGSFCVKMLDNIYDNQGFVRISLGIYNTKKDIDKLVNTLKKAKTFIVI